MKFLKPLISLNFILSSALTLAATELTFTNYTGSNLYVTTYSGDMTVNPKIDFLEKSAKTRISNGNYCTFTFYKDKLKLTKKAIIIYKNGDISTFQCPGCYVSNKKGNFQISLK